ncbi:Cell division cycle protein 23-like protein [Acropora cervicornis]|uniref:Cell division cycle protein 23-like protein n=1 Tax=Acropora cervicornis TaxID=6130 RepID=A0AAD9R3D5_ACRCE|nr:Cell division cycle protein 23-like protein [Acropora cervicornis]
MVLFLGYMFLISDSTWNHSKTKRFISQDFYEHGINSHYHYGIVIDCGSSGSRVFIYYWPPHNGISSLVDHPSQASSYLEPLLDFAAQQIPSDKHMETPLYILATAGMRMLSLADQESILDDLRVDIPLKYNFHFISSHVEVITGKQEGIYSWIGVNFELGRFDHSHESTGSTALNSSVSEVPRKSTVGSLDMGGGSAQIAFEVGKSVWVPSDLNAQVNLGCDSHQTIHNYNLYVATFLGFGGNTARDRYTELSITHNGTLEIDEFTKAFLDPCLPSDCTEQRTFKGKEYTFLGTGLYTECQKVILPLLNLSKPCPRQPCSFNGVYQPKIDYTKDEFYGFSEYWYSMNDVLRIGGQYSAAHMKQTVEEFCRTRWSVLESRHTKGLYPFADAHRLNVTVLAAILLYCGRLRRMSKTSNLWQYDSSPVLYKNVQTEACSTVLNELAFSITSFTSSEYLPKTDYSDEEFIKDFDKYTLGKTFFDLKEFDRAAFFLEGCTSPKAYFLYMYSRYLAGEKHKNDDMMDLLALRAELFKKQKDLDGYGLFLYGVVLKKLDLREDALKVMQEAVNKEPLHWGSWLELSSLCTDKETMNDEGLERYANLSQAGFSENKYILLQTALAHYHARDFVSACDLFKEVQKRDPYSLEHMDTYSNILYVKHEKAVTYFQRALKLNPQYTSAWTLMGHEFMERKNTSAAIEAYRKAIEVNDRDYRAWYGLGQTYEILKMPFYCLYYYRQAHKFRPNDSRMLVALGESYEKLNSMQQAKKILSVPDLCSAYVFLARFHLKKHDFQAAEMYAHKCCEYNEGREEGKAILREICNSRGTADGERKGADTFAQNLSLGNITVNGGETGMSPAGAVPKNLDFNTP